MAEKVRRLTEDGSRAFREHIERLRAGGIEPPPVEMLTDDRFSSACELEISVEVRQFASRIEFGSFLVETFRSVQPRTISRDAGLWNWLALKFFDQLCPADANGQRDVHANPHYVLEGRFAHNRYYKHLVRFAWYAVQLHGQQATVLLTAAGKATKGVGQWGEISEQLGGSQDILGSRTAIEVAGRLYLNTDGKPKKGLASSSGPGTVRRFSMVLRQLAMTHDLHHASPDAVMSLLPAEFEGFRSDTPGRRRGTSKTARRSIGKMIRDLLSPPA